MNIRILSNPDYTWKKSKRNKKPKLQKSIPDSTLSINKGEPFNKSDKAMDDYFYKGKPYGVEEPHL